MSAALRIVSEICRGKRLDDEAKASKVERDPCAESGTHPRMAVGNSVAPPAESATSLEQGPDGRYQQGSMGQPPPKESSIGALRAELHTAGLRATGPRLAVLRCLHAAPGPVSHGDVATSLAEEGWDRATVYRNLIDLTEAGILRRNDHGDHTWRFELRSREMAHVDEEPHPHFMCDACGDVVCLPDEAVQVMPARGTPKAIRKRKYEVQIKGRCDRCA